MMSESLERFSEISLRSGTQIAIERALHRLNALGHHRASPLCYVIRNMANCHGERNPGLIWKYKSDVQRSFVAVMMFLPDALTMHH